MISKYQPSFQPSAWLKPNKTIFLLFRLFGGHFIPHVRTYPNARVFLVRRFHYQKDSYYQSVITSFIRLDAIQQRCSVCVTSDSAIDYVFDKEQKLRLLCSFCWIPSNSNFLQNPLKMPTKSNLDAKSAKILQKSAFFFKNICTIQK